RGIAHEFLLPFCRRRDVDGKQIVLTVYLETVASKEEECRVAEFDGAIECEQRFAHRAPRPIFADEDPKAELSQGFAECTCIIYCRVEPRQLLVAIVTKQQRDALLRLGGRGQTGGNARYQQQQTEYSPSSQHRCL